ncbi:hypothetical protein [Nonomuraea endophytica]|uniref:hypothetical protein n=1 Tax=Nonomuraea endophytica TaxID=714136 RepID=UPI0037CA8B82
MREPEPAQRPDHHPRQAIQLRLHIRVGGQPAEPFAQLGQDLATRVTDGLFDPLLQVGVQLRRSLLLIGLPSHQNGVRRREPRKHDGQPIGRSPVESASLRDVQQFLRDLPFFGPGAGLVDGDDAGIGVVKVLLPRLEHLGHGFELKHQSSGTACVPNPSAAQPMLDHELRDDRVQFHGSPLSLGV